MEVKNKLEAWRKANELFPYDYVVDVVATERAGYDIYRSTYKESNSWISDLGNSLEVNIEQKDGSIWSTRIWIEDEPEIVEETVMSSDNVMKCCVAHGFYTAGTIADYSKMLETVRDNEYSLSLLYKIAKDIAEHSEDQTIENIMYHLSNDACIRVYTLK